MEDWLFGAGDIQCDDEVVLQFTDSSNRWMTLPEERGLSLSMNDLKAGLDPVSVAMALHKDHLLPESTFNVVMRMFKKGIRRENITEYLVKQLPSTVSLQNLVKALDQCGYTDLSAKLVLNSFKWNSAYTCLSNPSSDANTRTNKLYTNLKRLVNNAQLNKPRRFLRKMANRCYATMTKEMDPHRKQSLADQCIAIIGAETDTIAITFDKTLCRHVLFTQMKHIGRETSNTLISDLVYYGRLANAYAIAGDYEMCEKIIHEAKCKAYIVGPCIEFVNLAYIICYVTLWQFEQYPTPKLRSDLLLWGRIGLKCVEEDFVDNKNQWRRNLLLRMVLCLLGLGNKATVLENCPVDDSSITKAKTLLAEFDKYWDGIETRRKMFYYVAKARLCELENRYLDCLQYLKIAHMLSVKGNFEEIKYISSYYNKIEDIEHVSYYLRGKHRKYEDETTVNTDECLEQETVYHDHVLRRTDFQYDAVKDPDFIITKRLNAIETCQSSSSPRSRRRFQPVGCSYVSQSIQVFNAELTMEGIQSKPQQTSDLCKTECRGETAHVPPIERPPPSGDSQPDNDWRKHTPLDSLLRYDSIADHAKTSEEANQDKNTNSYHRYKANIIIDNKYSKNKHFCHPEKENDTDQRKDNNNVISSEYSSDAFCTNGMNATSYIPLDFTSIMQRSLAQLAK